MSAATTTPKPIAPIDLAAEREALGPALEDAVLRVLRSGQFVLGPQVEALERAVAILHGVPHAIGVASGTDALWLGLLGLGVEPGDRVLTSPFTFFASAASIALIGAVVRLADVDPHTALLDPASVAQHLDGKVRCILPVHLYGQLADMRALQALAQSKGLTLLEDGAQAIASRRDDYACGEIGDAATLSFYVTKNLGAAGEGGMIVTRHEHVAQRLRRLRDHGSPAKYVHAMVGTNSRLHALQAAVLNVKLPHLSSWNARRARIAQRYDRAFEGNPFVAPLRVAPGAVHTYHQYTVRIRCSRGRDGVQAALAERHIGAGVHYPTPVHLQEAARGWGYARGDFPHAESLAREVLCLPVHPFLSDQDVDRVIEALLALARD